MNETTKCACGDIYPADSFGAGFIAATGRCPNCDAAESVKQEPVFSIERHGSGWAIYQGRDCFHHGYNLGHLTETDEATAKMLESRLNAEPVDAKAIREDQRQKDAAACYARANAWKDNAAKAAKLCGNAIMAGVQT